MSKEPSLNRLLGRLLRVLLMIGLSLTGALVATFGAFDGEWTKAIFGLVLMFVADKKCDECIAANEKDTKKLNEIIEP